MFKRVCFNSFALYPNLLATLSEKLMSVTMYEQPEGEERSFTCLKDEGTQKRKISLRTSIYRQVLFLDAMP